MSTFSKIARKPLTTSFLSQGPLRSPHASSIHTRAVASPRDAPVSPQEHRHHAAANMKETPATPTAFAAPLTAQAHHSIADPSRSLRNASAFSTLASPVPQHSNPSANVSENKLASAGAVPGACTMPEIMECVVKIFVTSSAPNYLQPWQTKPLSDHLGSGFIIKGRRILTNAHVIADAVQVMVRRPGSPHKYVAKVLAAGHECDLALLEVEDEEFWAAGQQQYDIEAEALRGEEDALYQQDAGYATMRGDPETAQQLMGLDSDCATPTASTATTFDFTPVEATTDAIYPSETSQNSYLPKTVAMVEAEEGVAWSNTVFAPDAHPLVGEAHAVHQYMCERGFQKENGVLYLSREVPLLQESVVVVGYPMGGDNLCITQGVVSRVEPVHYAHAGSYLLAIQIDAAINPGNSGGPALVNGRVVGVAFQNVMNASSVGYIIPCSVVLHFLRDVEKGGYRIPDKGAARLHMRNKQALPADTHTSTSTVDAPLGFCGMGLSCQDTFNPALQRHVGMASAKGRGGASSIASTVQALMRGHSVVAAPTPASAPTPAAAAVTSTATATAAVPAVPSTSFIPDNTPAAYLHYRQIQLAAGAPPDTGVAWATKKIRIGEDLVSGVLVLKVSRVSPCRGVLQRGDVLVAIDDTPIASDGTVLYRGYERLSFDYLFSLKHRGDSCKLTYLRRAAQAGSGSPYQLHSASVTMRPLPSLVPGHGFDQHPHYYVFGGLVFVPLTVPYLQEFGKDWFSQAPKDLVDLTSHPMLFQKHQAVVMSQVLPDSTTVGYTMIDAPVKRCDGVLVKHLPHLRALVERGLAKAAIRREILEVLKESPLGLQLLDHVVTPSTGAMGVVADTTALDMESEGARERVGSLLALLSELMAVDTGVGAAAGDGAAVGLSVMQMNEKQEGLHRYNVALERAFAVAAKYGYGDSGVKSTFASLLSPASPFTNYLASRGCQPQPITYLAEEDGLLLDSNAEYVRQGLPAVTPTVTPIECPILGGKNPYNQHAQVLYTTAAADVGVDDVPGPGTAITRAALEACFGALYDGPEAAADATPTADASVAPLSLSQRISAIPTNDSLVFELTDARTIILDASEAAFRHEDITVKHNIPTDIFMG